MRTTIDAAGRVVVPKALRDALGLGGGREVDITLVDGRLEIAVPPTAMHLEDRDGAIVAVPDGPPLPPLTVEQVRSTLDGVRR